MKLKKPTKNLSLGQSRRRTSLGFNISSDRFTAKANVTEENSVVLKSFLDFLWNDAKKNRRCIMKYEFKQER